MADNVFMLEGMAFPVSSSSTLHFALGDMILTTTEDDVLTDLPDNWFPEDTSIGLDGASNGVKFWYPDKAAATDSVQLRSQQYPLRHRDMLNQHVHELGSGKLSILNATNSGKIIPVSINGVPTEKRQRLYKFLRNIVVGVLKTFQFEDEAGGLYTVRYWGKVIAMPMEYWLQHVVEIELRKEV